MSYNSAQFLGHLPGQRGARGPVPIGPGTLLVVDEASMMSSPDLADLIAYAEARGAKVILAGDTSQLQAVENGGGMSLLADRLGYVRLAEPVRFRAAWEQAASLRLRDGDTTVLAEYDQHARIIGGDPEQMMDAAAAAYVALTADGTDTLLMAADHALRRELSRRIRDDLIRLGLVQPGPAVTHRRRRPGQPRRPDHLHPQRPRASRRGSPAGPWPTATCSASTPSPADGLLVRRALDADPRTGQRRWTDRHFLYADYEDAELGYAVTDHAAQGRTVHTGLAVITGTEDRQHAYVALTRGTDANIAYVFTVSPKTRRPGPRPAPGPRTGPLRPIHRRTSRRSRPGHRACRAGHGAGRARRRAGPRRPAALGHPDPAAGPGRRRPPGHPARHLDRRDHPGPRAALPRPAHGRPAARPPRRTRPPGQMAVAHPARRRTGRPGPRQVLAEAIAERDLAGARDIAAVIDARLRRRLGSLVPLPPGPWSAQVPAIADPERRAYVTEIAALMDARKDRIGEHAAEHALPWAVSALGPVPEHPVDRLDWQRRAASIGAYRELSGYDHPADPIGPEPAAAAPDLRAAWHEALAALGPVDGPDVRGMPDGTLLHLRDTYPIETAWAPQWVGDELRQVRAGARDARLAAAPRRRRSRRRPTIAATTRRPPGTQALAASYQAMHDAYRERESVFAGVMADRADWEPATRAPAAPGRRRRRRTAPPPPRTSGSPRCARPNPSPPPTPSAPSSP